MCTSHHGHASVYSTGRYREQGRRIRDRLRGGNRSTESHQAHQRIGQTAASVSVSRASERADIAKRPEPEPHAPRKGSRAVPYSLACNIVRNGGSPSSPEPRRGLASIRSAQARNPPTPADRRNSPAAGGADIRRCVLPPSGWHLPTPAANPKQSILRRPAFPPAVVGSHERTPRKGSVARWRR